MPAPLGCARGRGSRGSTGVSRVWTRRRVLHDGGRPGGVWPRRSAGRPRCDTDPRRHRSVSRRAERPRPRPPATRPSGLPLIAGPWIPVKLDALEVGETSARCGAWVVDAHLTAWPSGSDAGWQRSTLGAKDLIATVRLRLG